MRRYLSILPATLITMLFVGCATPTQPSADIVGQEPHPSPINNFQVVVPDRVYRSGQPKGEADWNYLQSIGITTVVKLNRYSADSNEAEELRMAEARHIKVIPAYMPPDDFPHTWSPWAGPELKDVMKAVEAMEDKNNGKVLVHCSHGKDRTGLVVAIFSVRNKNYCKDAALAQMKYYGTSPLLFGLKPVLDDPAIKENETCLHAY